MRQRIVPLVLILFLPFFINPTFGQGEGARPDGVSGSEHEIGVGVGLGIVNIKKPLAPGGIYHLPDLPVVNTGEVPGTYHVRADVMRNPTGVRNPKGLSPEPLGLENAFRFSPQKFPLEPDQSQLVSVTLTLPLNTLDGDYLVYLEASPIQNPQKGVGIGPAAATKLYFTVKSGTVLGAIRSRIVTFVLNRPEVYLLLAAILLLNAGLILRRHFRLRLRVESK